jgi:hypothetical protein
MKYMMLFWVDEPAQTTADEDAAMRPSGSAIGPTY